MDIVELFTKKNIQILELLQNENLHIRDIASRLGCSPAKVHDSIGLFIRHGLVTEHQVKNKRIIKINPESNLLKKINHLLDDLQIPQTKDEQMRLFDAVSPLDYRYYGRNSHIREKLGKYVSEEAFVKYELRVELALIKALHKLKICDKTVVDEVAKAIKQVSAQEVYREEDKIKHNIRALVNAIRNKVSDKTKPFVHFTATSFDIFDTANSLRLKELAEKVIIPQLIEFEKSLINLALREKDTIQVGRTHGQHAEPITFGFTISSYVSRIGSRVLALKKATQNLRGKISGAVGAYNASSLFFKNPEILEKTILDDLGLKVGTQSSQIVEPEWITDFIHSIVSTFGVIANIADDMRALQRTEINEIAERFGKKQVGSSTMPHKRNPINFENVKSMWKEFMPRMITVYMDQISEHQRDLTNSASQRFLVEIVTAFSCSLVRLNSVMVNLVVDKESLNQNFNIKKDLIAAEPAYILLAAKNHPDAHEKVRELTVQAEKSGRNFVDLLLNDLELKPYISKFTKKQLETVRQPKNYIGISSKKVVDVCNYWDKILVLSIA